MLIDFSNEQLQSVLQILESCEEWRDFETNDISDDMTLKQLKLLRPISDDYFEAKKRLQDANKDNGTIRSLVETVACSEETAKWIFTNYHSFPSIDTLLDQPELEHLTNKQVKELKKRLKALYADEFEDQTEISSLEMEISSKLALDFEFCKEIVKKWRETENVEKIFENEFCEDITMKQQKAIATILTEAKSKNVNETRQDYQNRNQIQKLQSFLETIECHLRKNDMQKIVTSAEKEDISILLETVGDMTMTTLQKFQTCLDLLKNNPSDDILKETLAKSDELANLRNKFEELAKECQMTQQAKSWFYENVFELNSVDEFESCDFITIKQLKAVKMELKDEMFVFIQVKHQLRTYEKVHEHKLGGKLSGKGRTESKPIVEIIANGSLNNDCNDALMRKTESSKRLGFMTAASGFVSKKSKSDKMQKYSYQRELPSDEQLGQAEEMETEEILLHEQGLDISTLSGPESEVTEVVAETFPLITCADQTQGDRVVEQFLVRTEHIRRLCNLKDGCEYFFHDVSSGLNINFTELNNYEVDLIGVLGGIDNAKLFFGRILTDSSFHKLQSTLMSEGSGMYLVVPQTLYSSARSKGYIYFYSKNDQDYQEANPKSRAIHFIRYITQLTRNVLLLVDAKDNSLLAMKPSNSGKKKTRSQQYQICQLELQKEDAKLENVGVLQKPWLPDSFVEELHCSNSGLYYVQSTLQSPKVRQKETEKSLSAEDFTKNFKLSEISENANICYEFKEKYLEVYHRDISQEIEKSTTNTKAHFLNGAEDSDLYEIIDFAVIQKLMKINSVFDFELTNIYYGKFGGCREAEKWKTSSDFNVDVYEALPYESLRKLERSVKEKFKEPGTIKKLILFQIFEDKNIKLPLLRTFKSLFEAACKKEVFGHYYLIMPKLDDRNVQEMFKEAFRNLIDSETGAIKVEFLMKKQFKLLETLSSGEITSNREIQNSGYCLYKKQLITKYVQQRVEEEKRRSVLQKFSEVVQEGRCHQTSEHDDDRQTVISTILLARSPEMRFKIKYSKKEIEERKLILHIQKLALKHNMEDEIRRQPDMQLNPKMLSFIKTCRIELPQLDSPKVFPVNAGLALVTANCGNQSSVFVFGTSNGRQLAKIDFGKKISLSDFDSVNRILCMYSEREEVKELNFYQFDEEYKNCNKYSLIDLSAKFNFRGVSSIRIQYASKYVWVLESTGDRILKLHMKSGTVSSSSQLNEMLSKVGSFKSLHMAPNGQCLFLTKEDSISRSVMTESLNVLEEPLSIFKGDCVFQVPETNICLVASLDESGVNFQKLIVQGAEQELKLQEASQSLNGKEIDSSSSPKDLKHWMHNFFWVFVKFPCEEILCRQQIKLTLTAVVCDNCDIKMLTKQMNEVQEEMKASLKKTFKPTKTMCDNISAVNLLQYVHNAQSKSYHLLTMAHFLQKLIGFTPMQIARCQANEFLVLKDGVALSTETAQDVFEMKDNIDLGLFEAIFNWWPGNVKVISSMGKQTTGKSYMLNHVMGTSFNISGARCTDGCWMTLNVQEDCLYVVLDFEGLGSFERTDQDDMLLSLFNSALSTMTLFKTEHRIDRDTDQLFSKFNLGSDQLKGTGGIFNGSFVIVIKDVAEADLQDIGKEFLEKINNILLKEKHNNFISKLYKGGFHINPFPPFETEAFFEEMENLRETILLKPSLFVGGPMFRDTMKLLLAKLAINDFTPLGKQQIEARIKFIKNYLETALTDGVLVVGNDDNDDCGSALTLLDQQKEPIPEKWTLSLPGLELENIDMTDCKCHFTEDGFIGLVNEFSQLVPQTSSNFSLWRESLKTFVSLCLENRLERVETWISGNVAAWQSQESQEFDDVICSLLDKFNLEKTLLLQKIQLCDAKCSKCFLKCAQIAGHASICLCTTSHFCRESCSYCSEEEASPCKHPFGHENEHVCSEFSHICGQKCSFHALNACPNECVLFSNHEEDHVCSLKKHLCKKTCSVDICSGECQLDCSVHHETHKCAKEQCVHECCVENCKNKCTARNHFHGNSSLIEQFNLENGIEVEEAPFLYDGQELHIQDHFCGAEHFCGKECEEDGYCEVSVEKTVAKEEVFEGKRSTFTYKRHFVQNGKKLRCLRKVLPFTKEHYPPQHYCSTLMTKDHLCTKICPTCENICDKTYGHWDVEGDQKHHTAHGNMTKCYFICNREDFDVGDHKYKVGEQSVAEFCHLFCNSLGRGHIHVVECPGYCEGEFSAEHDHRRHETCKYGPNMDVPKDEIHHKAFWELIGFEDPCTGENADTFEKCPFYCSAISHEEEKTHEGEVKRYHCQLDLWHKPVVKLSDTGLTSGTVSKDGHVFPCHHEALAFHWVFALDKSGSMHGNPWAELQRSVTSFMHSRNSLAPEDKYSILLHDHKVYIIEEYKTVKDFDGKELAKWSASGGNDFARAVSESDKVINRHLNKSISPVFIFMSDGIWHNGEKEMAELARKYKTDYKLKVYTIGFGRVNFAKLKELARVGGGDFIECPTGIKLESSFLEIASSMPPTVSVTSTK